MTGELQREGMVTHLITKKLVDMTGRLISLMETPQHSKAEVAAGKESYTSSEEYKAIYTSRDFH